MWNKLTQNCLLVALLGTVSLLSAAETVGTVVTPGRVLINNLPVRGNATLNEGAVLKTVAAAARVELLAGSAVTIDTDSEAVVHRGGLHLRRGRGVIVSGQPSLEAHGLSITPSAPQTQLLVAVGPGKVDVAALCGQGRVRNQRGLTIAMISKEKPLSFESGGSKNESTVTGLLRLDGRKLTLRDELTGIDVELTGHGLRNHLNQRIQATGESRFTSDSDHHVILVSRLSRLEMAAESLPETGNSTSTAAKTSAARTGMSAGTKVSIAAIAFGGVAAAIAVPMAMSN